MGAETVLAKNFILRFLPGTSGLFGKSRYY
nr:MAG TPA: hypothetical protein [Caudoviricetes sp.]DAX25675.1 MAG TPA: hypothetical protein [Caudoviricetes sp.]